MRYDITNIPVGEVFEERDGCPLCRLRNKLEDRAVEYITGAAMMEPDIRMETNKQGFCIDHYRMMLGKRNRLGVALILESHLAEVEKRVFAGPPLLGKSAKKQARSASGTKDSCFVCRQVDAAMEKMVATVCRTWESQGDFRRMFEEQPCLCLPHFAALVTAAQTAVSKKEQGTFTAVASRLARQYLTELKADVRHFCDMYDYRNANNPDADWGNSKDAVERTIRYLTTREP